jgi:manganese-dependent inorganic pyrophosphatase
MDRKVGLMASMPEVAKKDGVDQILLFVIDIMNAEATMLIHNAICKSVAEQSFGVSVTGDTVKLAGIMSRKKQIIPNLKI